MVEYKIDGYEMYDKNLLQEESGRGMLLYIKSNIQHDSIGLKSKACEYIAAKIKGELDDVLLVSIYTSPNSQLENNDEMLRFCKKSVNMTQHIRL